MIANLRVPIVTICQFHVVMFHSIQHVTGRHTGKPKKKKNLEPIIQLLSSPVKHTVK